MKDPKIGSHVIVLEKAKGPQRDGRVWTVWSQSPTGWHLFIKLADGQVVWDEQPARLLKPAAVHA